MIGARAAARPGDASAARARSAGCRRAARPRSARPTRHARDASSSTRRTAGWTACVAHLLEATAASSSRAAHDRERERRLGQPRRVLERVQPLADPLPQAAPLAQHSSTSALARQAIERLEQRAAQAARRASAAGTGATRSGAPPMSTTATRSTSVAVVTCAAVARTIALRSGATSHSRAIASARRLVTATCAGSHVGRGRAERVDHRLDLGAIVRRQRRRARDQRLEPRARRAQRDRSRAGAGVSAPAWPRDALAAPAGCRRTDRRPRRGGGRSDSPRSSRRPSTRGTRGGRTDRARRPA